MKYSAFAAVGLALFLAACAPQGRGSTAMEQDATERNQMRLIAAVPPPVLTTSQERRNLVDRLKRLNTENMSGCVYLISYGQVMSFYPVKGKVTSLNAYLSGQEKIVNDPYGSMDAGGQLVESPDFDGAYGKNSDGIFFFTADSNAYVEWHGDYLFSDQCLKLQREPMLTREVKP